MYLDAKNPHDACPDRRRAPLDVVITGGVAGDQATVAALVNSARDCSKRLQGLLLMTDLPVPRIA